MPSVLKSLVAAGIFSMLAGIASIKAAPPAFRDGHLKIVSMRAVEPSDEMPLSRVSLKDI